MTHKRIAVLISGDYRGFDTCLPTMAPLLKSTDEHKVDIYFSTWSESHHVHPLDPTLAHHVVDITSEKIFDVLHDYDVKGVVVEHFDKEYWDKLRYNCPMVHRWHEGMKMIKGSGIDYDFVVITRPDLYFNNSDKINLPNLASTYQNKLGVAWADSLHLQKLQDIMFGSSMQNIESLVCGLDLNEWDTAEEHDWHTWWYTYAIGKVPVIGHFMDWDQCTFCRFPTITGLTFLEMQAQYTD